MILCQNVEVDEAHDVFGEEDVFAGSQTFFVVPFVSFYEHVYVFTFRQHIHSFNIIFKLETFKLRFYDFKVLCLHQVERGL